MDVLWTMRGTCLFEKKNLLLVGSSNRDNTIDTLWLLYYLSSSGHTYHASYGRLLLRVVTVVATSSYSSYLNCVE